MPDLNDLHDLLLKKESLNPILRAHIRPGGPFGNIIQHPLIQEITYRKEMNALINERYRHKLAALEEAIQKRNWSSVIYLHERPWRLQVLLEHSSDMTDQEYWKNVGSVWTDSENIWQSYDTWRTLWEKPRAGKRFAMDTDERKKLALMPSNITVYRGVNGKGISKRRKNTGMSWTLDRDKAEWFSMRWGQEPHQILTGTVEKKDVHAFFEGRNEAEIVATKVVVAK